MKKGLLAVFTGDGKGKTTAALGLTFRALGHGHEVCFIQFIKGNSTTGEAFFSQNCAPHLEFHVMGRGFTWKSEDLDKDREKAKAAWEFAKKTITENRHRMIILDEITYLLKYKMIEEQDVIDTLSGRPLGQHIIITGRGASDSLIELADLVTEMKAVKHPYSQGVRAQKGFEF